MKISCVCGYTHEREYPGGKILQGDAPFIQIHVETDCAFTVNNLKRKRNDDPDTHEVELYACPKCGTIRLYDYGRIEE